MVQETKISRRIISLISNHRLLVILVSFLFVALISIVIAYRFKAPNNLIMTTGYEGGSYANLGERYQQILAREKIHLKLLPSSGSVENLKRLNDKSFRVDAGFVQDGTSSPAEANNLVSLGAIGYSPFWVFYRGEKTLGYLSELRGKRIVIGAEGSGARQFAIDLLRLNNSADPPTVLLDLAGASANKALLEGKVDAAMMIGTEDNSPHQGTPVFPEGEVTELQAGRGLYPAYPCFIACRVTQRHIECFREDTRSRCRSPGRNNESHRA